MIDFFLIVIPFILAAFLIDRVMDVCEAKGMINSVGARSSHTKPTARGAGLIYLWLVLPAAVLYVWQADVAHQSFLYAFVAGAFAVGYMGWRDDQKSQSALLRIAVQILSVAVCVYFLPTYFSFWPTWLEKTLIVLAWVWFINLYNFMDGLDGLASMQAIFLCLALSFIASDVQPILLILMGTTLGLLRLNFPPAKIFLGDVGSTFLGFVLAGIMFYNLTLAPADLLWPILTLTLLFTGDATYTLIKRILQGKKPWQAHKEHWYQRAHQIGFSHKQVLLRAILINMGLLLIVGLGVILGQGLLMFVVGMLWVAVAACRVRYLEGDKK